MNKFKSRIREIRLENHLSYSQLASVFDKSEGAIRAWESGRTNPDAETLIALAKKFNVSTDYLLGVSDARKPENENLVTELGLTEKNLDFIKNLSPTPLIWEILETDKRELIDILNVFLANNIEICQLLSAIQFATASEEALLGANINNIGLVRKGVEMVAHDTLDMIIDNIRISDPWIQRHYKER